jgi:hypothetical protein
MRKRKVCVAAANSKVVGLDPVLRNMMGIHRNNSKQYLPIQNYILFGLLAKLRSITILLPEIRIKSKNS